MSSEIVEKGVREMNDSWHKVDTAMRDFIKQLFSTLPNNPSSSSTTTRGNSSDSADRVVHLNVGGQSFVATEGVLTGRNLFSHDSYDSDTSTFFSGFLKHSDMIPCTKDGHYFIERSPVVFALILDYLRDGFLVLENISVPHRRELFQELDFYQIPTHNVFNHGLQWNAHHLTYYSDFLSLDEYTMTLSKIRNKANSKTNMCVTCTNLHEITTNNTISWRVYIHTEQNKHVRGWVGVADRPSNECKRLTLNTRSGLVYGPGDSKGEAGLPPCGKTSDVIVDMTYSRGDSLLTFGIDGVTTTKKLPPALDANGLYPCVVMNSLSDNARVSMGLAHSPVVQP